MGQERQQQDGRRRERSSSSSSNSSSSSSSSGQAAAAAPPRQRRRIGSSPPSASVPSGRQASSHWSRHSQLVADWSDDASGSDDARGSDDAVDCGAASDRAAHSDDGVVGDGSQQQRGRPQQGKQRGSRRSQRQSAAAYQAHCRSQQPPPPPPQQLPPPRRKGGCRVATLLTTQWHKEAGFRKAAKERARRLQRALTGRDSGLRDWREAGRWVQRVPAVTAAGWARRLLAERGGWALLLVQHGSFADTPAARARAALPVCRLLEPATHEHLLTPEKRAQQLRNRLANLPAWNAFVGQRQVLAIRYKKYQQTQRALRGMAQQVRCHFPLASSTESNHTCLLLLL
jgi:hypothetical protein